MTSSSGEAGSDEPDGVRDGPAEMCCLSHMLVSVYVKRSSVKEIFAKLRFEETKSTEGNFFDILLGNRMKVDQVWNAVHSIVVKKLLQTISEESDLSHVNIFKEDFSDFQRELKGWSGLCTNDDVSGRAAEGKDVLLDQDVKGDETEVVNVGEPLLSGVERHVHRVSLDSNCTLGLVQRLPGLDVVESLWQLTRDEDRRKI